MKNQNSKYHRFPSLAVKRIPAKKSKVENARIAKSQSHSFFRMCKLDLEILGWWHYHRKRKCHGGRKKIEKSWTWGENI